MGIRDTINKRPAVAASALVILILGAALYAKSSLSRASHEADQSLAYFTDDDGKSYFADAFDKKSGFDHDGKTAYAAYVFSRDGGTPFVGYMIRPAPANAPSIVALTAAAKAPEPHPGDAKSPHAAPAPPPTANGHGSGPPLAGPGKSISQIKRPGEATWHDPGDAEGKKIGKEFGLEAQKHGLEQVFP